MESGHLKDVASSAEDFILTSTGIRGQVPDLVGYEKLKTYRLESYRAALYRQSPAPLVFAPGRFVVYNQNNQPVFKLETLEGSRDPWTTLYDFNGRHGLPVPGSRSRPEYTKSLTGNGVPDVVRGPILGRGPLLHRCHDHRVRQRSSEQSWAESMDWMAYLSRAWKSATFTKIRVGNVWPTVPT